MKVCDYSLLWVEVGWVYGWLNEKGFCGFLLMLSGGVCF